MPSLATLTLVWLGAQSPDRAASATLERWARDHEVQLTPPRALPRGDIDGSASLAERYESWLAQARDLLQAGDDAAAQELLDRLEQGLRQHPQLLPSSFLLAERYRLQARLVLRASADEAERFERLAEVMEGARATAFGEAATTRPAPSTVRVSLVVHGARRHQIYWDGAPSDDAIATAPGEHHLLIFRGALLAWSGWVTALASGKIDVWVPDAEACSIEDFDGVALESKTRVRVPDGVRCDAWLAVAPRDASGALSLAVCKGAECQAITTLGSPLASGPLPEERGPARSFLPPWAAWTLAGVGVAAATSVVLWRTGVFDTAPESKVIYDGTHL